METRSLKIPEREFGPAPWWAWLGAMTNATIDRNLKRFMAMEVYEIIIIPLYGLQPEYLGREYFDLYRHTCRRCREWGLKLWIYDEFNWPSGTCAGKVLRDFPRFRQHSLQINPAGQKNAGLAKPAWKIVENKNFQLAAYGAEWASGTTGYLDTLNPAAVRAYIDLTHEVYKREVGGYFGDVIVGFFTDEPVALVGAAQNLPYTPALFQLFKEKYGYDLRPRLLSLLADAPDARRVRADYWGLVVELFQKNFFRQYADWCQAHGLKMTGHLLHEEVLANCVHRNGDMYAMLSEMQTPGIDLLCGVTSYDVGKLIPAAESAKRDVTGKLIESIAYFAQKDRTLCEAFGCMPNSATMLDYKRAADFLFHHGLSLINDNLFADSLGSFRKFCGCHAFWTPWVSRYNMFSRHIRAMSYLNSGSRLVTEVGLYYPGLDARARYAPPRAMGLGPYYYDAAWDATQRVLHELAHGLLRRHWDYYLVFDQVLSAAQTVSGGLRMREFDCRALIFPDIHYISAEVAPVLRRFVSAGGLMLCAGRIPMVLDELGRMRPGNWGARERVMEVGAGRTEVVAAVTDVLRSRLRPMTPVDGPGASDVMATRRATRAGEVVFLTNFGARAADISLDLEGEWRRMDTADGRSGEPLGVRERLLPDESLLLLRAGVQRKRRPRRLVSSAAWQQPWLALRDEWKLRLPGGNTVSLPMAVYTGKVTAQPPARVRADDWAPPSAEMTPMELTPERAYWLRREVEITYQPQRLELVVDGCDGCEVFVNRHRIPAVKSLAPVWDDANLSCDIRKAIRRGHNEILVRYTPARIRRYTARMEPLTDLPPFVLRGDFISASRLDRKDQPPVLAALPGRVETGPLQVRGYPDFVGVAEYIQRVRLAKVPGRVLLDMGCQSDLFEVEINGRSAGVLGWPPYHLEVGPFLKRGDNRFVFRLRTSLGGILAKLYGRMEKNKPPAGMLETPVLSVMQ